MSWDLSSEEVICEKLESQQRTIEGFSNKIKHLQSELDSLKDTTSDTGWGQVHEASRYRQIHFEVEAMGGWANYRNFMLKKRHEDNREFAAMQKELELRSSWVKHHQTSIQISLTKQHELEVKVERLEAALKLEKEKNL